MLLMFTFAQYPVWFGMTVYFDFKKLEKDQKNPKEHKEKQKDKSSNQCN